MSAEKIPQIDSIQEMAKFWDTHDLADFQDQLEEVKDVFERESILKVYLPPKEADAVKQLAKLKGLVPSDLLREWILEKIQV